MSSLVKAENISERNQLNVSAANAVVDIVGYERITEEIKGDEKKEPTVCIVLHEVCVEAMA